MRTIIGWPAPNMQNTGKTHGSALGADETRATKQVLGFDPDTHLLRARTTCVAHARQVVDRGREAAQGVGGALRRLGRRPTPRARRCTSG